VKKLPLRSPLDIRSELDGFRVEAVRTGDQVHSLFKAGQASDKPACSSVLGESTATQRSVALEASSADAPHAIPLSAPQTESHHAGRHRSSVNTPILVRPPSTDHRRQDEECDPDKDRE
jgi:hypothetical protein